MGHLVQVESVDASGYGVLTIMSYHNLLTGHFTATILDILVSSNKSEINFFHLVFQGFHEIVTFNFQKFVEIDFSDKTLSFISFSNNISQSASLQSQTFYLVFPSCAGPRQRVSQIESFKRCFCNILL